MQQLKKIAILILRRLKGFISSTYEKTPSYAELRYFIAGLFSKQRLNAIIAQIYAPGQSDELKAFSAAFGIFIGIIPIWGFQTLLAVFLAVALKLNKALVMIFLQVSFPAFMPLIIFLSFKVGQFWTGNEGSATISISNLTKQNMGAHLEQYIYGSITLAILAALVTGFLTLAWFKVMAMQKQTTFSAPLGKAV